MGSEMVDVGLTNSEQLSKLINDETYKNTKLGNGNHISVGVHYSRFERLLGSSMLLGVLLALFSGAALLNLSGFAAFFYTSIPVLSMIVGNMLTVSVSIFAVTGLLVLLKVAMVAVVSPISLPLVKWLRKKGIISGWKRPFSKDPIYRRDVVPLEESKYKNKGYTFERGVLNVNGQECPTGLITQNAVYTETKTTHCDSPVRGSGVHGLFDGDDTFEIDLTEKINKTVNKWVVYIPGVGESTEFLMSNEKFIDELIRIHGDKVNIAIVSRPQLTLGGALFGEYTNETPVNTGVGLIRYLLAEKEVNEIEIHGHSMGGALAAEIYSKLLPEEKKFVSGITLQQTITSVSKIVNERSSWPLGWLPYATDYNYRTTQKERVHPILREALLFVCMGALLFGLNYLISLTPMTAFLGIAAPWMFGAVTLSPLLSVGVNALVAYVLIQIGSWLSPEGFKPKQEKAYLHRLTKILQVGFEGNKKKLAVLYTKTGDTSVPPGPGALDGEKGKVMRAELFGEDIFDRRLCEMKRGDVNDKNTPTHIMNLNKETLGTYQRFMLSQ